MKIDIIDDIHWKITYLQSLHLKSVLHGGTPFLFKVKDINKLASYIHDL